MELKPNLVSFGEICNLFSGFVLEVLDFIYIIFRSAELVRYSDMFKEYFHICGFSFNIFLQLRLMFTEVGCRVSPSTFIQFMVKEADLLL